ncbi:alpha-amylase family glycosyl hydrolase [Streptomyces shenzhenensis]|uniref:alpha-amylase family glycosyl hydrolase n=1 Tax=Streptomyces shenzhenensis TaxID=943815 RepID=UPI003D9296EA
MAAMLNPAEDHGWWRNALIYEVYPRSFSDSDGDGVGDLAGLIERLPYLASLGVDGVWLTPFQPSPQIDQGYDISDYCDVDPLFGSMRVFDELLGAAHRTGIRVLVDLVPNHTSTSHPMFRRAVAAKPGSPDRSLFHFRPGRGTAHERTPNNWLSVFGGPAWSRAPEQDPTDPDWYLHLFSSGQPDWNWEHPAVHDYFDGVLRFWFDRGADGVRIDVAHGLYKQPGLPDSPAVPEVIDGLRSNPLAMDQEPVHDVYRRWRRIAESYRPARLLVGEVNLPAPRAARYTRPDELHQSFAFTFTQLGWDASAWVRTGNELAAARDAYASSTTWALENHDLVRTATRFGTGERGRRRGRAALLALLGLPGAVYVYQGQELGLPEVDVPADRRRDPMWQRAAIGRDGARVPMPWTVASTGTHGFSPPQAAEPWLPVPPGWGRYAVEAQTDAAGSTLELFRTAVRVRRELLSPAGTSAGLSARWRLHENGLVECARPDGISVFIAMDDEGARLPPGRALLASDPLDKTGTLPPDTAVWWRHETYYR